MSEERKINGINEFLQMSMTNNMPLSVNEKRQIFDLIINLQNQLQQKENKEKEIREYITKQIHRNQQFYEMDIENILGILDKEVN